MKNIYVKPYVEVEQLNVGDVITASGIGARFLFDDGLVVNSDSAAMGYEDAQ